MFVLLLSYYIKQKAVKRFLSLIIKSARFTGLMLCFFLFEPCNHFQPLFNQKRLSICKWLTFIFLSNGKCSTNCCY